MEVLDAPRITPEIVAEHGLAADEYDRILKALGREPIESFQRDLLKAWGDPEQLRTIRFPLSFRIGRF